MFTNLLRKAPAPNQVPNPGMEIDSGWLDYDNFDHNGPLVNEQSNEYVHSGDYSRKAVSNPASAETGFRSTPFYTYGQPGPPWPVMTLSFWGYAEVLTGIKFGYWDGLGSFAGSSNFSLAAGVWSFKTWDVLLYAEGNDAGLFFVNQDVFTQQTFWIDDVSWRRKS